MRTSKQVNKQTIKQVSASRHEGFAHGFVVSTMGIAICYVAVSLFTNLILASTNLTPLKKYISTDDLYSTQNYPNCPEFVTNGTGKAMIVKEKCSNTYWPPFDLPNKDQGGNYIGYTYDEAKNFCENMGSPTLHYNFNEGAGIQLLDQSANHINSTIYGATWVNGKLGQALRFDGVDDYAEVTASENGVSNYPLDITNQLTLSAWVYPENVTLENQSIIDKLASDGSYRMILSNNRFIFSVRDTATTSPINGSNQPHQSMVSNTVVEPNKWYFVTAVFDTNTGAGGLGFVKLYVNGVLDKTTGFTENISSTNHKLAIGWARNNTGSENFFKGIIDDVRVYNHLLTASEINKLYTFQTPSLYRLPTVDELMSLIKTPCLTPGACSEFYTNSSYNSYGTGAVSGDISYANGAYWALNPLDILPSSCSNNRDIPCTQGGNECDSGGGTCLNLGNESASSVSLKDGTVNTPIMGKDMRLNVRCIYDKPRDLGPINDTLRTEPEKFSLQWPTTIVCADNSLGTMTMLYRTNQACDTANDCSSDNYPICENVVLDNAIDLCISNNTGGLNLTDVDCDLLGCTTGNLRRDNNATPANLTDDKIKCQ